MCTSLPCRMGTPEASICLVQIMTHLPSKFKSSLPSFLPSLYVCVKLWETSGEGEEEKKSGDFKAVFCHPGLTQVLLSPANWGIKSYM